MRCVWTSLLFASAALWGTSRTQEETRWATVRRYDNGECLGEPSYVSREDDSCHPMPTEAGNANYRSFLVQYDCTGSKSVLSSTAPTTTAKIV
eukprot:jgi/Pico_ML_1/51767/g327.t1